MYTYKSITVGIIAVFLILATILSGCDTSLYDPILFSIRGQVFSEQTGLPIDSASIDIQWYTDSRYTYTDTLGVYCAVGIGKFTKEFEISLAYEKEGYLPKDTVLLVIEKDMFFDSVNVYLSASEE
ncbi:MAG: hypothetical protein JW763_09870 [candidate division Zixibacteria bacterium]|nr:hypothetical protein [candidate division Zixibacteria bacterium]